MLRVGAELRAIDRAALDALLACLPPNLVGRPDDRNNVFYTRLTAPQPASPRSSVVLLLLRPWR